MSLGTTTSRHRIGVDLGGTKIEAVVVQLPEAGASAGSNPAPLVRARVPTNRDLGYDHVLSATRSLILDVARQADVDALATPIGIGMPGSVTMRRSDGSRSDLPLIKNSNTTCLNGRPFRADLEQAVGRSIAFANDANCFALAEATWGAARGARVAFGVIMGTGVGGGVVLTNDAGVPRAWDGAQGIAGEWGHVALDPVSGPPCYCGRRGCIEQYLSGPAIEGEYARRAGTPRKLPEIATRAADVEADAIARELIAERIDIFGRALATVIDILDPDAIVLGGGVSNLGVLYDEGPTAVARWVFNDDLATKIVKHALGDSAGVLGAALLP
ncbi:MAG: family Glucokinase [Labilithrix sp.]|nr:family Glucokinase [Labilithrix sp.]